MVREESYICCCMQYQKNMKKSHLILLTVFLSFNVYSQECGFDSNESILESNKKMEWFVKELTKKKLTITNDKNDIPPKVKKQLDCLNNGFSIANPKENYQSGCIVEKEVPSRHLNLLAKNDNYIVLIYNTYSAGISGNSIWIKYDDNGITDYWKGSTIGGLIIDSKFDLNKYIVETEKHVKKMNAILYGIN